MDDDLSARVIDGAAYIPISAVRSLASFREWYHSEDFPEEGRICYLADELYIEVGYGSSSSHVSIKAALTESLNALARDADIGRFFGEGIRVVHKTAKLSAVPDGTFVSWSCVEEGRVILQKSGDGVDLVELVGTPNMVLEIVSTASKRKDGGLLKELYHKAGIPEYWLIDVRKKAFSFAILRTTPEGYVPAPDRNGWLTSKVFARRFRMERSRDRLGLWQYSLLVRPEA